MMPPYQHRLSSPIATASGMIWPGDKLLTALLPLVFIDFHCKLKEIQQSASGLAAISTFSIHFGGNRIM